MTRQEHSTAFEQVVELVAQEGTDAIAAAFATLLELGMRIEREQILGAAAYERTDERRGYANGFKPKTLDTRAGRISVQVPKARGVEFYPSALEKGVRSERALKLAIAEMYVKGISTRKVTSVMRDLCGFDVSSSQVSRAAAQLDVELQAWRSRPIGQVVYLIIDARYEKVRHGGAVVDCAILTAIGILPDGARTILGTSCSLSEAEVHWRAFLESLIARGMYGVRLIASDDHAGIRAAREALFPGVPWQRRGPQSRKTAIGVPCQFHLAQNAMAYVPRLNMRRQVAEDIRTIFNAADHEEAQRRLDLAVQKYQESAPTLAEWMETNLPEGFTVFALPAQHRRRLRTTNMLEAVHKEIKRRTRVATLFPNEASVQRLISAILCEIDEEWSTGRRYLTMEPV